MLRNPSGTRLWLPEPALAWVVIVLGVLLIALGTLCALRIRAHMWGGTRTWWDVLLHFNRATMTHWIHEYDEPDKWLMGLGLFVRFPAAVAALWAIVGLAWTG